MKKREIGNLFLHLGLGFGLALAACWSDWMLIPGTFVYAWLREQAQHRYIVTKQPEHVRADTGERVYNVEKRGFFDFGWLGGRQIFEILQWTLGAAIGCGVWHFIR